jgi:oxaloacetate decarboxylase alpha subunit/pyruvate carboxylase subunit B
VPKAAPAPAAAVEGTSMLAPMPGMIIRFEKNVGDEISEGETAVILEAMKMENALPAPAGGTVKAINFSSGDSVAKGDVLCVIG